MLVAKCFIGSDGGWGRDITSRPKHYLVPCGGTCKVWALDHSFYHYQAAGVWALDHPSYQYLAAGVWTLDYPSYHYLAAKVWALDNASYRV
jgi:hypothetical protein